MIDVKELKVLNQKDCRCGYHEFTLEDVRGIDILQDAHGFYGNLVKHYSKAICPECGKETILLLKQVGQTWEIMNTAISSNEIVIESHKSDDQNVEEQENKVTEQATIENKQENNSSEEFICSECGRVFKNKLGLNSHMRTHQN